MKDMKTVVLVALLGVSLTGWANKATALPWGAAEPNPQPHGRLILVDDDDDQGEDYPRYRYERWHGYRRSGCRVIRTWDGFGYAEELRCPRPAYGYRDPVYTYPPSGYYAPY